MSRWVFLVSLCALAAEAKCMGAWAHAFPPNGVEVPLQPHVLTVLGGTYQSVDPVKDLEFAGPGPRVGVEVVSSFEGYRQHQVWLRPAKPLTAGRWALRLKNGAKATLDRPLGSWVVSASAKTDAPAFTSAPKVGALEYAELGCGPASSISVSAHGAAFVEAKVTVKGETKAGVFVVEDGAVAIGHGMCSGGFELAPGVEVRVELTPLDVAGQRGTPSEPVTLIAPGK